MVADALDDSHLADLLVDELRTLRPEDDGFRASLELLLKAVREHIAQEEQSFPTVEEQLAGQLDRMGDMMEQRRQEILARRLGLEGGSWALEDAPQW
jgi:hypothetical protein